MFLYILVCKFQIVHLTGLFISGHSVYSSNGYVKFKCSEYCYSIVHLIFFYSILKTDVFGEMHIFCFLG